MAAPDEIRSTDKLLKLIRTPSHDDEPGDITENENRSPAPKRAALIPAFKFQKKFTVGVDIGHTYIKIAKTARLPDKSYELLDYIDIPLTKQISLQDPQLLDRLKSALDQICGNSANYDIWSAIPSAKVETQYLRIPKLPRKQMANAIFWTFTKKVAFNDQEEILDYEILGDVTEGGVKKTEVMAFKTPKAEAAELKAAFDHIGYPLKGISIVPFAVQNLFRANIIAPDEQDVCCLFVGRDWSRIAIYSKGSLILSRGIKAGMRSMVEAIEIAMLSSEESWPHAGPQALEIEDNGDNEHSFAIHPAAQRMFFDFIGLAGESLPSEKQPEQARLFQMILPALERLIRQVERTFEHYAMNFYREGVRRIYLSGQITASTMIVHHFSRQLDLSVEVMNPFIPDTSFVRPVNIPETQAARESYVPAIGLALSRKTMTPNALFTHQHRDREENIRRTNMRVLTGCLLCLMALIGIFSWQERQLDTKRAQIAKLNDRLLTYNPPAEKEILLALYAQNKNKHQAFRQIVQRYAPVAVLKELTRITPAGIRLIRINAEFSGNPTPKGAQASFVTIEGIIFGAPEGFETALTGYLLGLKNSPLFNKPSIQKKNLEYYNDQEVLNFRAKLEII